MCLMFLLIVICFLITSAGCSEWAVRPGQNGFPDQLIEPTLVGALVDTVSALTVANTASTPVNPYSTPIGIGLAGVIAMLEALRRKEKSARKNAETRLNGNHTTVVSRNNVPNKT